ncbi:MAG: hypothetical protein SGPRY_013686, partial [Prymnesium sp.]
RFFGSLSPSESVGWEWVSRELVELGILAPPSVYAWLDGLVVTTPEPPSPEMSIHTLQALWEDFIQPFASQLAEFSSSAEHSTPWCAPAPASDEILAKVTSAEQGSMAPGSSAVRRREAFSAAVKSRDIELLNIVSKFDRDVKNRSIDPHLGFVQFRRIFSQINFKAAPTSDE